MWGRECPGIRFCAEGRFVSYFLIIRITVSNTKGWYVKSFILVIASSARYQKLLIKYKLAMADVSAASLDVGTVVQS